MHQAGTRNQSYKVTAEDRHCTHRAHQHQQPDDADPQPLKEGLTARASTSTVAILTSPGNRCSPKQHKCILTHQLHTLATGFDRDTANQPPQQPTVVATRAATDEPQNQARSTELPATRELEKRNDEHQQFQPNNDKQRAFKYYE